MSNNVISIKNLIVKVEANNVGAKLSGDFKLPDKAALLEIKDIEKEAAISVSNITSDSRNAIYINIEKSKKEEETIVKKKDDIYRKFLNDHIISFHQNVEGENGEVLENNKDIIDYIEKNAYAHFTMLASNLADKGMAGKK